ncbi:MAG: Gfo/Idh/MocA family oxidoreductase [Pirellulales bacterium]|nr:Gfo/Idh/MocA family oxidoreductase [Pirellulales bacterium]
MTHRSSRRDFLKAGSACAVTASLTATSYAKVLGANERISIGVIGCGRRGLHAHMKTVKRYLKQENVEITAVCDPWRQRRETASQQVKQWTGKPAREFISYRDVVVLDDIDAVMIASCDHQHTTHMEAAANNKKHIYCEKPLAMDLDKLNSACDAVRDAGICFQAGTQVRSYPTSRGCRKLFQSGALGKISRVEQVRNSTRPYWYSRLAKVNAKDVDWKEFLGDRPMRPFNAEQFTGWYGYRDFSDGPIPGLATHYIDLINFITGTKFPISSVAQGGVLACKDEFNFTCPDQCQATWEYPEGFLVSYSSNLANSGGNRILMQGDYGTLSLTPWSKPTISDEGARKKGTLGKSVPIDPVEGPEHILDWLQCMRSGNTPNASIDAGYQQTVPVIMAMKAFDTGQKQVFVPEKRQIRSG